MKLQQLSKKIDNLKLQVYDVTVNKYANFIPKLHSTEQLVSDVAAIKEEMDEVSSKIENEVCTHLVSIWEITFVSCDLIYMFNIRLIP